MSSSQKQGIHFRLRSCSIASLFPWSHQAFMMAIPVYHNPEYQRGEITVVIDILGNGINKMFYTSSHNVMLLTIISEWEILLDDQNVQRVFLWCFWYPTFSVSVIPRKARKHSKRNISGQYWLTWTLATVNCISDRGTPNLMPIEGRLRR